MNDEVMNKLREICLPIVREYDVALPDLVVICNYRLGGHKVTREDIHNFLRSYSVREDFRYVPYYDRWRPGIKDMKSRTEFLEELPLIIKKLILFELMAYVRSDTYWKRRHVYQAYIDEMDVELI